MPYPVARFWGGLAKEVTPGTALQATTFWRMKQPAWKPNIEMFEDDALGGSMVAPYDQIAGQEFDEFSCTHFLYADTIGHVLLGALAGADAVSGTGPYTHVFSLLNSGTGQPPTYTIEWYDGFEARQMPYSKVVSVGFKSNPGGLVEVTPKWVGFATAIDGSPPSASISAVEAAPAWAGLVSFGGSSNTEIQEFNIEIARGTKATPALTGTVNPLNTWSDVCRVSGKFVAIFESDTVLNYYLNNVKGTSLDMTWTPTVWTTGDSLKLHCSTPGFKTGAKEYGKEYVTVAIEFIGLANATDTGASGGQSNIKATLVNQQSAAY